MNEINNLIYTLEINYTDNLGLPTLIHVEFHDNGLEVKSFKIGDTCITEETINGRVLGGKFENLTECCGYRYDYQNGEDLLNINPQIPIYTAVSLINMKNTQSDFLSAKLVLSSIVRNDYRVIILNEGNLNIIKTVSAENEKSEHCCLQETVNLLKLRDGESFVENNKKRVYKIDDRCVIEENQILENNDIKSHLIELSNILSQNPQNYKELLKIKNQNEKTHDINEEKTLWINIWSLL